MLRKNRINIRFNRFKRKIGRLIKIHKIYIFWIIFVVVFLYSIFFFYNKYINNPENIVSNVYFKKDIANNLNLLNLIETTTNVFSGTNTAKNKILGYKSEKNAIKNKFSFIQNIKVDVLGKNVVKINYKFLKPKLLLIGSGNIFAVYKNEKIYKFNTKYKTGLNINIPTKIYLPSYIKEGTNIQNIFWKNKSNKLIKYIKDIKNKYPKAVLFYIVGGENIKVLNNGKTIYFSLKKSIDKQLSQLNLIKNQKNILYTGSNEIDVGNLDEGIYLKGNKNQKTK